MRDMCVSILGLFLPPKVSAKLRKPGASALGIFKKEKSTMLTVVAVAAAVLVAVVLIEFF